MEAHTLIPIGIFIGFNLTIAVFLYWGLRALGFLGGTDDEKPPSRAERITFAIILGVALMIFGFFDYIQIWAMLEYKIWI